MVQAMCLSYDSQYSNVCSGSQNLNINSFHGLIFELILVED